MTAPVPEVFFSEFAYTTYQLDRVYAITKLLCLAKQSALPTWKIQVRRAVLITDKRRQSNCFGMLFTYYDVTAKCQNSEEVFARQREGKRFSMDTKM
jgi:hypothetical protein